MPTPACCSSSGAIDFAGGTVVHINAGIAGLVGALMIGKRIGYGKELMAPHSLTMSMIGASLLWVGWFGFNAGSNLEASGGAGLAMANTLRRHRRGRAVVDVRGMDRQGPSLAARRAVRRGRGSRRGDACGRLLRDHGCDRARPDRRRGLPDLLHGHQERARLRRLARRVRRALCRRHRRRDRHRHPGQPRPRRHRRHELRDAEGAATTSPHR